MTAIEHHRAEIRGAMRLLVQVADDHGLNGEIYLRGPEFVSAAIVARGQRWVTTRRESAAFIFIQWTDAGRQAYWDHLATTALLA